MKKLLLILPIALLAACGQVSTATNPTSAALSASETPNDVAQDIAWAKGRTEQLLSAQWGALQPQMMEMACTTLIDTMTSHARCETVAAALNKVYEESFTCSGNKLYMTD